MNDRWQRVLRLVGVGWYITAAILVGILGGVRLDGVTLRAPLFTLLGLGIGLAAAAWGVYRLLADLNDNNGKRRDS